MECGRWKIYGVIQSFNLDIKSPNETLKNINLIITKMQNTLYNVG